MLIENESLREFCLISFYFPIVKALLSVFLFIHPHENKQQFSVLTVQPK